MKIENPIYLDYHSTTPLDPRVLETMLAYLKENFGNPASSTHVYGWKTQAAIDMARETICTLLGETGHNHLIFTSGATESNNWVIKGLALGRQKAHFISQKTEHPSVLEPLKQIQKWGHEVTLLDVDSQGLVDPQSLKEAFKASTVLVTLMYAHNEIGTIQNIKELSNITHQFSSALFHSDATQAVGKIPVDVINDGIDFLSCSAHKLYGPKGVGALYFRKSLAQSGLQPLLHGGGQEGGWRSGTSNVAGIMGFARAFELACQDMDTESARMTFLKDLFLQELAANLDHLVLIGHPTQRLAQNINLAFQGVPANILMSAIPEIAITSGSACASDKGALSHVMSALGLDTKTAESSIRFGLGRFTTEEQIRKACFLIIKAVKKLRADLGVFN